jgi:transcriptional regulator with XRE-family HTH domain
MVGKQIKELRERQGLTQAALAEKVGIERSTVTRIEAGSMNPTVGILTRIATALGASVEILLTVCD